MKVPNATTRTVFCRILPIAILLAAFLRTTSRAQVINVGTCTQTVYVAFCGSTYAVTLAPGESKTLDQVSWDAAGCVYGGCFYQVSQDFAKTVVLYKIYNPNGCCAGTPGCDPPHVGDAFTIGGSGCTLTPPDDGPAPPCGVKCCGMPVWTVSESDVSLLVHDEPLGYQPATGPRLSFRMMYYQREPDAGLITNTFSIGRRWNFSWFGKVKQQLDKDNNVLNVFNFSDGLKRTYINSSTIEYLTSRRLTGDFSSGYGIVRADGSRDFYGMLLTNNYGVGIIRYLSETSDPEARSTHYYYAYNPTNFAIRLTYVVDGDGRTNTITYVTSNPYSTNLIASISDPFGRTAYFDYNERGCLTNVIDVAGISTSFLYDEHDFMTNMTTPYGTTSFKFTDNSSSFNGRSVLVTQPDGGHQLYRCICTPTAPRESPVPTVPVRSPLPPHTRIASKTRTSTSATHSTGGRGNTQTCPPRTLLS